VQVNVTLILQILNILFTIWLLNYFFWPNLLALSVEKLDHKNKQYAEKKTLELLIAEEEMAFMQSHNKVINEIQGDLLRIHRNRIPKKHILIQPSTNEPEPQKENKIDVKAAILFRKIQEKFES
jgi:hypothetical protein